MCGNVYDNSIDFEVCGFTKNTKNLNISRTKHFFFFIHYILRADMAKNNFLDEVTFKK